MFFYVTPHLIRHFISVISEHLACSRVISIKSIENLVIQLYESRFSCTVLYSM